MTTVKDIADEIVDLQSRKNSDYGNAFGISMAEFGLIAPAIRLTDKLNRFKSLIKKDAEIKSESIEDTLIDLAAYAMMTVAEMRNEKSLSNDVSKAIINGLQDTALKLGDEVAYIGPKKALNGGIRFVEPGMLGTIITCFYDNKAFCVEFNGFAETFAAEDLKKI